jgi:hypothetical protein
MNNFAHDWRPTEDHYWLVAQRLLDGFVIPFLGAGANLLARPPDEHWKLGMYMPSGAELADILAEKSRYPDRGENLLRVAQYVDAMLGERALYQYLHALFDADYPPNSLHCLLARAARVVRERGSRNLLIISTNYDDALERAFRAEGEAFDLLWYEAKRGQTCGKFMHTAPDGETVPVDLPNEYDAVAPEQRAVILKLHGAVNRLDPALDSFVITENNYIDYLARGDIVAQIPVTLHEPMVDSHFLFLGYSMRDWNLRVILSRLWGRAPLDVKSWAVQLPGRHPKHNEIERKLWADRGDIELFQLPLEEYVPALEAELLGADRRELVP